MTESQILEKIVIPSLEKASLSLPHFDAGAASREDLVLYGGDGALLDSLNLVSLIFIVEEEAAAVTGSQIKFAAEDILNLEERPFFNAKNLAAFLKKKIDGLK